MSKKGVAVMANTSSFSFTNTTLNTHSVTPVDLKPVTNYAKLTDEPDVTVLSNKTATLDQGELLTYSCKQLDKVTTQQTIQNPSPVRNGVEYRIKLDEILRTVDANGVIIRDEPIVASIVIRHQSSGSITSALITQVFQRLVGACMRTDGTYRWDDLMRSALVPVED